MTTTAIRLSGWSLLIAGVGLFVISRWQSMDAIKAFAGPVIEVHVSNIHARDKLHRHSILSAAATAVISMRRFGSASRASTQARTGGFSLSTQAS